MRVLKAPTSPSFDVGFLAFDSIQGSKQTRAMFADELRGNSLNLGARVIKHELEKAGMRVGVVSPRSAHTVPIVLISLTSTSDCAALYAAVHQLPSWSRERRTFKVIAGGYGLQNPNSIREYVDTAVFGRAEDTVIDIVANGREFPQTCSAMDFMSTPKVEVRQARSLYESTLENYQETFQGCPLKCKFCHYTFARAHSGGDHAYDTKGGTSGDYVQTTINSNSMEVTWPQLMDWQAGKVPASITVGVDGFSERVRFAYGKRIADWELTAGLERISATATAQGKAKDKPIRVKLYQIAGMPGESIEDRRSFERAIAAARFPEHECGIFLEVHATPFLASPLTPMAWEPYSMESFRHMAGQIFHRWSWSDGSFRANARYGRYISSPLTILKLALIERHDASPESDRLFELLAGGICRKKYRTVYRQYEALRMSFNLERWTGRLELDAPLATDRLYSYVDAPVLRKIAVKMRAHQESGLELRGRRTICGNSRLGPEETLMPLAAPAKLACQ